jgi:hypothetical protein
MELNEYCNIWLKSFVMTANFGRSFEVLISMIERNHLKILVVFEKLEKISRS